MPCHDSSHTKQAARMYFRAAVDYGTRNEQRRWVGVALDFLERGALLLQMILMTQVATYIHFLT